MTTDPESTNRSGGNDLNGGANITGGMDRWSDQEIDSEEHDRFGFQDYARVLAKQAREADTPLTIGLLGRWGSGKTSLMKLIQREVQKPASSIGSTPREAAKQIESVPFTTGTLWINVWQLSNQEELWRAFLQSLFTQVHEQLPRRKRIKFDWTLFHRRVKWPTLARMLLVNSYRVIIAVTPILLAALWPDRSVTTAGQLLASILTPLTGGAASLVLGLWLVVRPAIEAARDKVSLDLNKVLKDAPYEARVSALQQLEKQFSELVKLWVGDKGRLIVLIDDLDRCTPTKIHEVLEAIKLFATTPRCVYVLGIDHDIVRKAIQANYRFDTDAEASDYLDKIVQIPFYLPPLGDERIDTFVRTNYPSMLEECPTAPDVFSRGIEPNPRKVKRTLNIYRTLIDVAAVRVKEWEIDPVEPELVAKMVVIQSRFRLLYAELIRRPELIVECEKWARKGEPCPGVDPAGETGHDPVKPAEATDFEQQLKGLVPAELDRSALTSILNCGKSFFCKLVSEDIDAYIYLTSAVESRVGLARPTRKERAVLLGGDFNGIKQQVDEIAKRYASDATKQKLIKQTYIDRLRAVWKDDKRYAPEERRSASKALWMLGDWWIEIPAGPFLMGSAEADQDAFDSEKLQHEVNLPTYRIGRYPVANVEYLLFVQKAGHSPPVTWTSGNYPTGEDDRPVTGVSWHDAVDYCKWLTERLRGVEDDLVVRLPTEAEWEKAARWDQAQKHSCVYPWGDEWDAAKCNAVESGIGTTTPVGKYSPQGDSPYGVADMSGNVWEWCHSLYQPYPYEVDDGRENQTASGSRVLRGGSFYDDRGNARCAYRYNNNPVDRYVSIGFRVVVSPGF